MPRQPEVPTNWLHCVHLAGLGGGPQVLAQPGGEAGLLSLAADADVGGGMFSSSSAGPPLIGFFRKTSLF